MASKHMNALFSYSYLKQPKTWKQKKKSQIFRILNKTDWLLVSQLIPRLTASISKKFTEEDALDLINEMIEEKLIFINQKKTRVSLKEFTEAKTLWSERKQKQIIDILTDSEAGLFMSTMIQRLTQGIQDEYDAEDAIHDMDSLLKQGLIEKTGKKIKLA